MTRPDAPSETSVSHREDLLDEALEESFPASDPIALSVPSSDRGREPRIWFITGSARGLGRDIVVAALEAGDRVAATARDVRALDALVAAYGARILPLALDVADEAMVEQAVAAARRTFGRLDVVVNNAGYANMASIEDLTLADFKRQVDTNFYGVVHVTKAVLPILRAQRAGHIFQIASVGARFATVGLGAYQSAKFAVRGFSLALSQEVAALGIKVTVIEPGGIRTDWAGASMDVPPISPAYADVIGPFVERVRAGSGKEPSDPARIAHMLVELAGRPDAPVELLLGVDAFTCATRAAAQVSASDAKWEYMSNSVSFTGASAGASLVL